MLLKACVNFKFQIEVLISFESKNFVIEHIN